MAAVNLIFLPTNINAQENTCSVESNTPTQITFTNNTANPVNLYWVNYECQEVQYQTIQPQASYTQDTFVSHPWRIRDSQTGELLKEFTPTSATATEVVVESNTQTPNSNNQVNPNGQPDLTQIQQRVHEQVNQYRASQGLPPVQLDSRINEQMQAYAQQMANAGQLLNHQGMDQRAQVVLNSIPHKGYAYYENEHLCSGGCNGDSATSAVQGWINSSGHRNNMLSQTELTGIGVAVDGQGNYYIAQMFIHVE
ncbi:MAG: hypothetical protein Kow0049_15200 [Stanieria sp.]